LFYNKSAAPQIVIATAAAYDDGVIRIDTAKTLAKLTCDFDVARTIVSAAPTLLSAFCLVCRH
jgi:hypothetical protein